MSSNDTEPSFRGPVEDHEWPEKLKAHVVTPGIDPRMHGYDVEADVARHYALSDMLVLALTGELPDATASHWVAVALHFHSAVAVQEAPAHAALLTRLCAAATSAVIATAGVVLAEQARALMERQRDLIRWLGAPTSTAPARALATADSERASVARMRAALSERGAVLPNALDLDLGREAAIVSLLHSAGLTSADQIETALVWSRLPCAVAEALAIRPMSLRDYPMELPDFAYEDPR